MADQKLTDLTAVTSPVKTDLVYLVVDPGGTPLDRKSTIENLLKTINDLTADASPTTDDLIATINDPAGTPGVRKVTLLALKELFGCRIGFTAYAAGSDTSLHHQTSNTLTDMDATNAIVTFTAPASGKVLIKASILHNTSDNATGTVFIGIKESTTTVAETYSWGINANLLNLATRHHVEFYVTGISAGSHTYKLAHRVTAGACDSYTGPTFGQVIIEVYAVP